jgi:hypothetical protein
MAVSKTGRSTGKSWYHGFMISKKTGEPPVIIAPKLKNQFNDSIIILIMDFFNVDAAYKVDTAVKEQKIEYEISTGKPYFLDTVQTTIATPRVRFLV